MSDGHGRDLKRDWGLHYAGRAEKDVARLDRPMRQRILASLEELSLNPTAGQLRKLTGRSEYRLRVGECWHSTRRHTRSSSSACFRADERTTADTYALGLSAAWRRAECGLDLLSPRRESPRVGFALGMAGSVVGDQADALQAAEEL